MPSVRLGSWAVSSAANFVGVGQATRGGLAAGRTGSGGSNYFVEGTKNTKTFDIGDDLYRVYGDKSLREGRFAYTQNPGNQITAIRNGSLPPGNSTNSITRITFNGLVQAEVSKVASLFRQPGGFTQVLLPKSPYINYSLGRSLPYGFMPFVPYNFFNNFFWRRNQ